MTMLEMLRDEILPAAYALLPSKMTSTPATALLLAIALQESGLECRRQVKGPARGFWQFETIGVAGVLEHRLTRGPAVEVLDVLAYAPTLSASAVLSAVEHNDLLAAALARLLLWPLRPALPARGNVEAGWQQYVSAWRPGKPRRETWTAHYDRAWNALEVF